jgi:serine/threonine protein kinase
MVMSKIFNEQSDEIQKVLCLNFEKINHLSFINNIPPEIEIFISNYFILYEFSEKNNIKNILIENRYFNEKLSLIIFEKIAKQINALHKIHLSHLNIDLENIYLDENYDILISGFNLNQHLTNTNKIEYGYDIFQLGILLLQLITGKCDLKTLEKKTLKFLQNGNDECFWKIIELQNNQKFSNEIKELINIMIKAKNNSDEMTLDTILNEQELIKGIGAFNNEIYLKDKLQHIINEEDYI